MKVITVDLDDDLLLLLETQAEERGVSIDVIANEVFRAQLTRDEALDVRK